MQHLLTNIPFAENITRNDFGLSRHDSSPPQHYLLPQVNFERASKPVPLVTPLSYSECQHRKFGSHAEWGRV